MLTEQPSAAASSAPRAASRPRALSPTAAPGAQWRDLPLPEGVLRARAVGFPPADVADPAAAAFTVGVCTYRRPESTQRFLHSLVGQVRAAALLLVDASEDDLTEQAVSAYVDPAGLADYVAYYRVAPERRGSTRQYNFALALTGTPLIVFFDDDVVLLPDCLRALVDTHVRGGPAIVGVGAAVENEAAAPAIWRVRRLLGIVPSLTPGRYFGSGVSTPWGAVEPGDRLIDGDWLPGCAMMWKSAVARAVGFDEALEGYGCGNDLVFSLRMAVHGRLVVAAAARVLHLQEPAGRPDPRSMGYQASRNAHAIHRAFVPGSVTSRLWFAYATAAETLLAATGLLRPARARAAAAQLRGIADYWVSRGADRAPVAPNAREG